MSLINDALKRAQQHSAPSAPPPLRLQAEPTTQPPAARTGSPVTAWLLPAILIFLVIAVVFVVGWAAAHRSVTRIIAAPEPMAAALPALPAQAVQAVQPSEPPPVSAPIPDPSAPAASLKPSIVINPANAPKLQGIFYSPSAPSAILDGQTVRPGDSFLEYRVKEITQNTVTLTRADGSAIRLGIGH